VIAASAGDFIAPSNAGSEAMPNAKSYLVAAAELRREARRALDPCRRNRLWEYALEYDECAAALVRNDDPAAAARAAPVAGAIQGG
jgi:hypothetical protein